MENTLLDILILGLLVLVFGSIFRTRPSTRLRYWIIGWVFILLHFSVSLPNLQPGFWNSVDASLVLATLTLGGVAFLMAAVRTTLGMSRRLQAAGLLCGPSLAYIVLTQFGVHNHFLLLGVILAQAAATVAAIRRLWGRESTVVASSALCVGLCTLWAAYIVFRGDPQDGAYPMFTQVYAMNAVLYWNDFRRTTVGVVIAVAGLIAWAAVFPSALVLAAVAPNLQYSSEIWNLPKYFVEFGMILTLMEDSIIAANRQREEYRLLFDHNPHPMWIYDEESMHFLKVNEAAVLHYGYSVEDFSRMTLPMLRPDEDRLRLEPQFRDTSEIAQRSRLWTHIRRDGSRITVEIASHEIQFEGRKARFALIQDVTSRQLLHERLVHQANHDILTGLPNRLLLKDRMERTLATSQRNGEKAAVICLDLDRFKQINDRFGHHTGDMCLKHLADLLSQRLRAADTVARSGGEEFTVVLGGLAAPEDAANVAQSLIQAIRQPFESEGYNLEISASLGIAIYPDHGAEAQSLWRAADVAMYRAKKSGGNQFVFVSNEISSAAAEVNEIESHLRTALRDNGFELYYQPQYSVDGPLCGLEALLRFRDPTLAWIGPDRFIPIAEESGLIVRIGNWILEEVCRQVTEWQTQGLSPVPVALNISPLQLMRADFAANVRDILASRGMDPHLLEIEITETTMMRNLDDAARQMHLLNQAGVRFSVDDFGTGYSSLRHLHHLPIDTLKIDRSFVDRICEDDGAREIVQAIVSLAHSLDMNVIAEGVEREEQLDLLRNLDCDQLQGFLRGRPLPAEEVPALLQGLNAKPGPASAYAHPHDLQTYAG